MSEAPTRDPGAPLPWADIVEALHALLGAFVSRTQYPGGHPAVARADVAAAVVLERVLEQMPELIVALVDGEFVIAERPMPGLGARLPALAAAFQRHRVDCLVFVRGLERAEIATLGDALSATPDPGTLAQARDQIRKSARHVLVRFIDVGGGDEGKAGGATVDYVVPEIEALLYAVEADIASGAAIDRETVRATSRRLLARVSAREYQLYLRSYEEGLADLSGHAANVAMMTAAMLLDSGVPPVSCVDAVAAALLHDIGHLLLPEDIRGLPEPLLDARGRSLYRHHPFLGARALLAGGCPSLWVAAALEHHRGIDGLGYPELHDGEAPHEAVTIISLASYVDDKRASIAGGASTPDDALGQALSLAGRYFDQATITLFMRGLGVYPPGTVVELSDGAYAIVTRANPNDPRRPEVELLFGPHAKKRFELREHDTVDQRFVRSIVRATAPPLVLVAPAEDGDVVDDDAAEEAAGEETAEDAG